MPINKHNWKLMRAAFIRYTSRKWIRRAGCATFVVCCIPFALVLTGVKTFGDWPAVATLTFFLFLGLITWRRA